MCRCSKLSILSIIVGCLATLFLLVQCEYNKEKYSVGLFAASAVSSNGKRQRCMGTCYGDKNRVCRIGRNENDVGTDCKVSDQFVARYYTLYSENKTRLCMSDCSNFSGSTKKWCVTESNWYECTKEIPRRITRKRASANDFYPSSGTVYVADNPTDAGTRCVNRCAATDDSMLTFKCYDTDKKLVNCYPSPDATKLVKSFHEYARRHPYDINDKGHLFACPVKNQRQRRDTDEKDTRHLESIFNGINTVQNMASQISNLFPVETLRWPDPDIYPDLSTEPIIEYAVRIPPTVIGDRQTILPMMVRAIYSNNTRATLERSATYDEVNYARQNPRIGRDDHGHLVPHILGGTEDPYNIVPQARGLNRGGPWGYLEGTMRDYIYNNQRGTIEHTVVVNYDFTTSYRPTSFAIQVRFYNENRQLVNEHGRRLSSFAENVYDNFYLINEDRPCGT